MELTHKITQAIRDVHDFPKEGIVFKDITPIMMDAGLSNEILEALALEKDFSHKTLRRFLKKKTMLTKGFVDSQKKQSIKKN